MNLYPIVPHIRVLYIRGLLYNDHIVGIHYQYNTKSEIDYVVASIERDVASCARIVRDPFGWKDQQSWIQFCRTGARYRVPNELARPIPKRRKMTLVRISRNPCSAKRT